MRFVLNNEDNGSVVNVGWSRRDDRLSTLLCTKAAGLWRYSSSNHKYAMNDGYYDKDAAWELA